MAQLADARGAAVRGYQWGTAAITPPSLGEWPFWAAGAALATGPALLSTFLLLGRPPLSPPTARGSALFGLLVLAMTLAWWRESGGARRRVEWSRVLAGYAPLALGGPLAALLFVPEVNHWLVTVPSVRPALTGALLIPTALLRVGLLAIQRRAAVSRFCWRWRYALSGALYAALALASKPSLWHTDLPAWFVPAVRRVLEGHALQMYGVRADVMGTPSPIEHGPLTILFYAPLVALAQWAGAADFLRVGALFPLAGVLVVDVLLAYQVTRAVGDLEPRLGDEHRFGVFVLLLFSPLVWFSSVWLVHLESLQALLLVVSVRLLLRGRGAAAGAVMGCSLLVKHSAALSVGPLLLALFLGGVPAVSRRAVTAGTVAALVAGGGLLPLLAAAPADFAFNFLEYDAIKPIYGVTIWKALYDTGLEPLAMRYDSALIGLLALAGGVAVGLAGRRAAATKGETEVWRMAWAAVFLGQCAWLGLTTWQYPHYALTAFVAMLILETAVGGAGRWPVLALLVLFVPYSLQSHMPSNVGKAGGPFVVARAVAQLAFLYGAAVAVGVRLLPSGDASGVKDPPLLAAHR
ncbi:MAG TPA: hypothetical protein VFX49_00120 [Chloroflexota bacterium]|nr:hypothetical protein [Chloroflexota bacterium]